MKTIATFLAALALPFAVHAQCSGDRPVHVGGEIQLSDAGVTGGLFNGNPATFIDLNRPAVAHVVVDTVSFEYLFQHNQLTVQFASFTPSGRKYVVRNATAPMTITAFGLPFNVSYPEVHQVPLNPPLVFEPGDVLGMSITPAADETPELPILRGEGSAGTLVTSGDAIKSGSADLTTPTVFPEGRSIMGAFAGGVVGCSKLPDPQLIVPVTGDVTGRVHYTTDVSIYLSPAIPAAASIPVQWSVRDRLSNPGAPTIFGGTVNATPVKFRDSFATVTGLPPNYLGPMTLTVSNAGPMYTANPIVRFSDDAVATARIAAQGPQGDTGSSVPAVSCDRVGHVIAIPFHRTANQRVNIGVASAQLASCGVFQPAKAFFVEVNDGSDLTIAMPAESIQLDDITGEASPLPEAKGLTDGVVRVAVTDEAARIVAYASVIDNTTQAGTITVGRVER